MQIGVFEQLLLQRVVAVLFIRMQYALGIKRQNVLETVVVHHLDNRAAGRADTVDDDLHVFRLSAC